MVELPFKKKLKLNDLTKNAAQIVCNENDSIRKGSELYCISENGCRQHLTNLYALLIMYVIIPSLKYSRFAVLQLYN